jgi:sRNA-binding carbon storage regulator CsrA
MGVQRRGGGLVVTRRRGETVVLTLEDGRQIYVTLVETVGARARLRVEAPKSIRVNRAEVEELYGAGPDGIGTAGPGVGAGPQREHPGDERPTG